MKRKTACLCLLITLMLGKLLGQVPTANFSITPNPVCSGEDVYVTDLSTGSPTAWSYTVTGPPTIYTSQNPTVIAGTPGTRSIALIATNSSGSSTRFVITFTVLPRPIGTIAPSVAATCPNGPPITLSVNPNNASNTYSWSTGANTHTITVSPQTNTVYSCIVTNSVGCSSVFTKTVTSAIPDPTINARPFTICQGGTCTLVAVGSGMQPFTYSWSTSATTRAIATNVPGVYTVTFTTGNGCVGSQSYTLGTSTTLSLNATSNPSAICKGGTAFLAASGASSYSWSTGGTFSITNVTPSVTTSYTVDGSTNTCTGSAVVTVTVNTTPTLVISPSQSLCNGSSATISVSGAIDYSWSTGATSPVEVLTPSITSSYTVEGTNPGCPSKSTTVTITVYPSPSLVVTSSKSVACVNDEVVLSVTGADTFSWSTGSTTSVTTITASLSNILVTVRGTDTTGCSTTDFYSLSVIDCVGLTEQGSGEVLFKILPTIGHEIRVITPGVLKITVVDNLGSTVRRIECSGETLVSGLRPGIYYLVLSTNDQRRVRRVLITD